MLRVVKQSLVTNMLWDIQNLRKQQIMQDIQNVSYFFFFFLLLRISKSYKEIEEESLIHVYSLHYYIDITRYYQIYDFFS